MTTSSREDRVLGFAAFCSDERTNDSNNSSERMFTEAVAFLRFFVALVSEFNIVDGTIDRVTLFVAFGAGLDLGISNYRKLRSQYIGLDNNFGYIMFVATSIKSTK